MANEELVAAFQLVEDELNGSLITNDPAKISKCLSEDWLLIQSEFGMIPKEKFLLAIAKGELAHEAMQKQVTKVQVYGDIAIVISKGINKGSYKGTPFNAEHWVSNTYKKLNEKWICIMSHETAVTCE